jgi:hypothetical protein
LAVGRQNNGEAAKDLIRRTVSSQVDRIRVVRNRYARRSQLELAARGFVVGAQQSLRLNAGIREIDRAKVEL